MRHDFPISFMQFTYLVPHKADLFQNKTCLFCSSHLAFRKLGAIFGYLGFWAGKMEKNFLSKMYHFHGKAPKKW